MFQAANLEAVRAAQDVGEHLQREAMRQKVALDQAAEEQGSVRVIPESERLRAEEREGRRRHPEEEYPGEHEGGPEGAEDGESAGSADGHLDLLA
ncbi:MAG: hypothetical protein BWY56_01035 [Acidobacteria bacterium ADurb.Bin340]|nr:MAG: hypothetical protein BWY56_01035 [Acidobacteria bacterium ADurb.Bin340]